MHFKKSGKPVRAGWSPELSPKPNSVTHLIASFALDVRAI
jgi:hypothetical protein